MKGQKRSKMGGKKIEVSSVSRENWKEKERVTHSTYNIS